MNTAPHRLEKILQKLEDMLFSFRVYAYNTALYTMVPQPSDLRSALNTADYVKILELGKRLNSVYEKALSINDKYAIPASHFIWHHYSNLGDWIINSQRIYAPSAKLIELLQVTRLPDFDVSSIHFVADSFAIQLEETLSIEGSDLEHDFLFCSHDKESGLLTITSYPAKAYQNHEPFTLKDKKYFSAKDPVSRARSLCSMEKRIGRQKTLSYIVNPKDTGVTYESLVATFEDDDVTLVYKIVIGLNLYLQTNRKNDTEHIEKLPKRRSLGGNDITSDSTLFTLKTMRVIPQRPADETSPSGRTMPYHFREAYWRRPKGFGHIPDAEKTEWIDSTWVRPDRKSENPHVGKKKSVE